MPSAHSSQNRITQSHPASASPEAISATATTTETTSKIPNARALHSRTVPSGPYFLSSC